MEGTLEPRCGSCAIPGIQQKCNSRFMNERLTNAHRVLGSTTPAYVQARTPATDVVETVYEEQLDFHVETMVVA